MNERRAKRSRSASPPPRTADGSAQTLALFLNHPNRPPETLSYHELQGFLFAIATAPEMVLPSEWMPEVFGGKEALYADMEEARTILGALMVLYNEVNASIRSGHAALPADCRFRRNLLANFEPDAPVSLWSRGFMRGYLWLIEDWKECIPDDFEHDFGALLMTLSFFTSQAVAESYLKDIGRDELKEEAGEFRLVFPDAVAEFARVARMVQDAVLEDAAASQPPAAPPAAPKAARPKVGRNDPCSCGSGRKYKKCCGSPV